MKIDVIDVGDIEVHPLDTIWSLKWKIYHRRGKEYSPDEQVLMLPPQMTELNDCERTLEFYGIQEGSKINCYRRILKGESDFQGLLDAFRTKERGQLSLKSVSRVVGAKQVCGFIHEVRMIVIRESLSLDTQAVGGRNSKDCEFIGHIVETKSCLKKLMFLWSAIGDGGVAQIAKALERNFSLLEVQFCHCNFQAEGAKRIGEMLWKNDILTHLDVSGNGRMGDEGVIAIAEGLERNASLKELNLGNCGIGTEGAKRIGEMLRKNATLIKVILSGNMTIGNEGFIRIAEGLEMNYSLQMLQLPWWHVSKEIEEHIRTLLKRNQERKSVMDE